MKPSTAEFNYFHNEADAGTGHNNNQNSSGNGLKYIGTEGKGKNAVDGIYR